MRQLANPNAFDSDHIEIVCPAASANAPGETCGSS